MSGSDGNLEVVESFVDKITSVWKKLQSCDTNTVLHNYQIDCLKSELPQKLMKSKRLLSSSNINDISNLVQHAIPLGWQLTTDSFGRNRLTKMGNNGTYETIVENYQESINRAIELVELVALKDK